MDLDRVAADRVAFATIDQGTCRVIVDREEDEVSLADDEPDVRRGDVFRDQRSVEGTPGALVGRGAQPLPYRPASQILNQGGTRFRQHREQQSR